MYGPEEVTEAVGDVAARRYDGSEIGPPESVSQSNPPGEAWGVTVTGARAVATVCRT